MAAACEDKQQQQTMNYTATTTADRDTATNSKGGVLQTPLYADVLTELKKSTFSRVGGKPPLPLAPMQSCLHNNNTEQYKPPTRKQTVSSITGVRERAHKSLDDSQKRLKAIEDHMWQYRQEERDLRRAENDIVRQQKYMQTKLKKFENDVAKRQAEETSTLLDKGAKFTSYWQRDLHHKNEASKDKSTNIQAVQLKLNEGRNKYIKNTNEMSWKYGSLVEELDHNKGEIEELSKQFEAKLREKEEEQLKIKQELASMAITLNMESHKKRKMETEAQQQLAKTVLKDISDTRTRDLALQNEERNKDKAETHFTEQQREIEQTFNTKSKLIKSKQRQDGRQLAGVRTSLQKSRESQQYMQQEMDYIQLSMMNEHTQERISAANSKREKRISLLQKQTRDKNINRMNEWTTRALQRQSDAKLKQHNERLKQLTKVVSHHDSVEHSLFSQAREADSNIKRQNQTVSKLQYELDILRKTNARKIKEVSLAAERAEIDLQQKLQRENAELSKAINTREETIRTFHNYKSRNKEDRKLLDEQKKEHERRVRIADRSTLNTSTLTNKGQQ